MNSLMDEHIGIEEKLAKKLQVRIRRDGDEVLSNIEKILDDASHAKLSRKGWLKIIGAIV